MIYVVLMVATGLSLTYPFYFMWVTQVREPTRPPRKWEIVLVTLCFLWAFTVGMMGSYETSKKKAACGCSCTK